MKSPFLSKINWVGVIMLLSGILAQFEPQLRDLFGPEALAVAGAVVVVLRTWFTGKPVTETGAKF